MRNKSNFVKPFMDEHAHWKCPKCGNDFSHLFHAEKCDHKAISFSIVCEYCGCREVFNLTEHKGIVELHKELKY